MAKLVHAQTIMEEEKLMKLKELTGKEQTKEALIAAVDHFIECQGGKE